MNPKQLQAKYSTLHYWCMRKISIFILFVINSVVILGSIIYLAEGQTNGLTSIPQSIYWAIVTIATVGYGDIAPATQWENLLQALSCCWGMESLLYLPELSPLKWPWLQNPECRARVPSHPAAGKEMTTMRSFVNFADRSFSQKQICGSPNTELILVKEMIFEKRIF